MNRHCNMAWKILVSSIMVLGMPACGDGPGNPGPPQGPPRPVTSEAFLTTAHFDLAARPAAPRPGEM